MFKFIITYKKCNLCLTNTAKKGFKLCDSCSSTRNICLLCKHYYVKKDKNDHKICDTCKNSMLPVNIIIDITEDCCICKESIVSQEISIKVCSYGGIHKIHSHCMNDYFKVNPNKSCFICK